MSSNRFKLNADKTDFIWLGTRQQLSKENRDIIVLDDVNIKPCREVTLLGVVIDEELKFTSHIKRLTGRCYYQLRQLRTVRRALFKEISKLFVHALIISRLDYCNSVFNNVAAVHRHPINQSSTPPDDLLSKGGSTTTSPPTYVIISTGYQSITGLTSSYVHWCTSIPLRYVYSNFYQPDSQPAEVSVER